MIANRQPFTIDLLYGDQRGGQRTISRFTMLPAGDDGWFCRRARHWHIDRPTRGDRPPPRLVPCLGGPPAAYGRGHVGEVSDRGDGASQDRRAGRRPTSPTATPTSTLAHAARGHDVVDLVAAHTSPTAVFELDVDVRNGKLGGPYIHGRDGQRFIYLSWGELDGDDFRMFRRAKLHVDHLDPTDVDGRTVEGTLTLTDDKGNPLCASVRPPRITWTVR